MSYDLMVFERTKAPTTKKEFMAWYEKQMEWEEEHDYQTISVSSPALQNWFMEMKEKFPPMNGEYAPNDDALDDDENLELHMVDYSIVHVRAILCIYRIVKHRTWQKEQKRLTLSALF